MCNPRNRKVLSFSQYQIKPFKFTYLKQWQFRNGSCFQHFIARLFDFHADYFHYANQIGQCLLVSFFFFSSFTIVLNPFFVLFSINILDLHQNTYIFISDSDCFYVFWVIWLSRLNVFLFFLYAKLKHIEKQ